MRLTELRGRFIRWSLEPAESHHGRRMDDGTTQWGGFPTDSFSRVETLSEADGLVFLCPKAFATNGGSVGTHSVMLFFAGSRVPAHLGLDSSGKPARWTRSGSGLDDLTLAPSIQETMPGCMWHGFVENGSLRDA